MYISQGGVGDTRYARTPATSLSPSQLPGPHPPRYSGFRHLGRFIDTILVLVALGFIVFAFLVLASDGKPMAEHSREDSLLAAAAYVGKNTDSPYIVPHLLMLFRDLQYSLSFLPLSLGVC